jgi:biopolymer transport protein ExbD
MNKKYEPFSSQQDSDIDLKPFINFLVVLIPVLMISAEFSKIAIVEASAFKGGSTTDSLTTHRQTSEDQNALGLSLLITDSTITLGSNSGFLPTLFYREYHTYVSRENRTNRVTVAYDFRNAKSVALNPATGKPFGIDERECIDLYVIDGDHQVVQCLYAKNGGMVTDINGAAKRAVRSGEKVYVVGPFRTSVTVDRPADFSLQPLSAYDELRNRLMLVKVRAGDQRPDGRSIRIAAESSVIYDKIIQIMDVARTADYSDISIARFRG